MATAICPLCEGDGQVWDPGDPDVGWPGGYEPCPECSQKEDDHG